MGRGKVNIEGSPSHRCRFSSPSKSNTRTTPLQLAHVWLHFTNRHVDHQPLPWTEDTPVTAERWHRPCNWSEKYRRSPMIQAPLHLASVFRHRSPGGSAAELFAWKHPLSSSRYAGRQTSSWHSRARSLFFSSFLSACQVSQRRGLCGLLELWDDGQLVVRTSSELRWIAGCFVKIIDEH